MPTVYDPKSPAGVIIERWMEEIGSHGNDPLVVESLNDGAGFAVLLDPDMAGVGEDRTVTACYNWDVRLEADTLDGLAALMENDLLCAEDFDAADVPETCGCCGSVVPRDCDGVETSPGDCKGQH